MSGSLSRALRVREEGREGGKVPVTAGGGVTLESCNNCLRWCSEDAEP